MMKRRIAELPVAKYCTRCGYIGVPVKGREPRRIYWPLAMILLVFFLIPGVLYLMFGGTVVEYPICASCGARRVLIPVDSPRAQAALSNLKR